MLKDTISGKNSSIDTWILFVNNAPLIPRKKTLINLHDCIYLFLDILSVFFHCVYINTWQDDASCGREYIQ